MKSGLKNFLSLQNVAEIAVGQPDVAEKQGGAGGEGRAEAAGRLLALAEAVEAAEEVAAGGRERPERAGGEGRRGGEAEDTIFREMVGYLG